jgi:hypothetical protein
MARKLAFPKSVRGRISEVVISLMVRTELHLVTVFYSQFNHLMRLLDQEYFIQFARRENFKLYNTCNSSCTNKDDSGISEIAQYEGYVFYQCLSNFLSREPD